MGYRQAEGQGPLYVLIAGQLAGILLINATRMFKFMKTAMDKQIVEGGGGKGWARSFRASGLMAALLLGATGLSAQINLTTLGGGYSQANPTSFSGSLDGNTRDVAQFSNPWSLFLANYSGTSAGTLYVADLGNKAVRKLDLAANLTTTVLTNLNDPVGVFFDGDNNLYVLTRQDGRIHGYDSYLNYLGLVNSNGVIALPTAFTRDSSGTFFVTDSAGKLWRVHQTNGTPVQVLIPVLNQPAGIALTASGQLAISESGTHTISLVSPGVPSYSVLVGVNGVGYVNGAASIAKLNTPKGLALAPNGSLVVADQANHRYRLVATNGSVSTLVGVYPWEEGSGFPGWADGGTNFAEANLPMGVVVASDGTVFSTELGYHLVRRVSGTGLNVAGSTGGTGGSGSTNIVVLPPTVAPLSGYYPTGVRIQVSSTYGKVVYTTDGSEPTTNSPVVPMVLNQGAIEWHESLRDLSSLRVRAYDGTNASQVVVGQSPAQNTIGFTRDMTGGVGSTVMLPVVVNASPGTKIKSLQYLIQISTNGAAPDVTFGQFRIISTSTNDFARLIGANADGKAISFSAMPVDLGYAKAIAVNILGDTANLDIQGPCVVAMVALTIPTTAVVGDSYSIQVLTASGTTDSSPNSPLNEVLLVPISSRTVTAVNRAYLVGDTSSANWYGAGEFGDGLLQNSDVVNVFYASLGVRVPYAFTDLYDAMDAFPDDFPGIRGGDGELRMLDWQRVWARSLGLYTNQFSGTNWYRSRSVGGGITNSVVGKSVIVKKGTAKSVDVQETGVWLRNARLGALTVANVQPGTTVAVPVYLVVNPGVSLRTLQFCAEVLADNLAPQTGQSLQFQSTIGGAPYTQAVGNQKLLVAWGGLSFGSYFPVPLQGSNILGRLLLPVPLNCPSNQSYTIRFVGVDSADPLTSTQFDLESFPGRVWVQTGVQTPAERVSDEWRRTFFGSVSNAWTSLDGDPDNDGLSNLQEYQLAAIPPNCAFMDGLPTGAQVWGLVAGCHSAGSPRKAKHTWSKPRQTTAVRNGPRWRLWWARAAW
jgi:hypothetical protein